ESMAMEIGKRAMRAPLRALSGVYIALSVPCPVSSLLAEFNDVTRIYNTGGSLIRTSKQQLSTPAHVDNCLRVLQHHRVRYLVTIGGTQTAYSASLLVSAAAAAKFKLSIVHVPKVSSFISVSCS